MSDRPSCSPRAGVTVFVKGRGWTQVDVNREVPFKGLHWFIDHAETISQRNMERVAALGGGIAIQHRIAYQGEYFRDRYGEAALLRTPPLRQMLRTGLP